jgi:hypothetical protein
MKRLILITAILLTALTSTALAETPHQVAKEAIHTYPGTCFKVRVGVKNHGYAQTEREFASGYAGGQRPIAAAAVFAELNAQCAERIG